MNTLLFFLPACFALNMVPGPNNLLAMNNAKQHGIQVACAAGVGRIMAFSIMITLAASGLATILYASEMFFFVVKVLGACYLFWIAFQLWNAEPLEECSDSFSGDTVISLARQEFILAIGNPKAILIFTAFLPQFVDPTMNVGFQFFILGAIFLLLEWFALTGYGLFGIYLRHWFSNPRKRVVFNRCCSGFLASSGLGLLLTRRD